MERLSAVQNVAIADRGQEGHNVGWYDVPVKPKDAEAEDGKIDERVDSTNQAKS